MVQQQPVFTLKEVIDLIVDIKKSNDDTKSDFKKLRSDINRKLRKRKRSRSSSKVSSSSSSSHSYHKSRRSSTSTRHSKRFCISPSISKNIELISIKTEEDENEIKETSHGKSRRHSLKSQTTSNPWFSSDIDSPSIKKLKKSTALIRSSTPKKSCLKSSLLTK